MSELRERSAILADFVEHWNSVGGPSCRLDELLLPEILPRIVIMYRKNSEWMYWYAGEMHGKVHGIGLSGRVRDLVPPHIWARESAMLARCLETHMAQMVESTGHFGRSVDTLTRSLRVMCRPPEGADAAIATAWEWDFHMDWAQEEVLADLVERCAGPVLREQFLSDRPGVARVSAQLALLRELVEGAYGNLSPADRTYLQVFLLGLYSEYDTDGDALYRIH